MLDISKGIQALSTGRGQCKVVEVSRLCALLMCLFGITRATRSPKMATCSFVPLLSTKHNN